jgi:DNA-binding NtrC family response regulator
VFSFDLPLQYASRSSQVKALQESKKTINDDDSLRDVCVAVIDNDISILNATQKLLQSYGAVVLTAQSSGQSWQEVQASGLEPDIFLVDHGLGKESGTDLIQAIHEKYGAHKPCILITGDSSAEHVEKFNLAKLPVMFKPLTDQMLIQAIHEKLGLDRKAL